MFTCEHGSHHHILIGTVNAIEVSDEGGLELHVSSPRFWGAKIFSLMYSDEFDNRWRVVYIDQKNEKCFLKGKFQLL